MILPGPNVTILFDSSVFIFLQGLFLLWWGLWFPFEGSLWSYMATTGAAYLSGASAVVVCGLYWRRASTAGALASLALGCIALLPVFRDLWPFVEIQSPDPDEKGMVQLFLENSDVARVTGFAASWIGMVVVSLIWPDRREES